MKTLNIKYPPGSEWLYLRIYGGARSLEDWLCGAFRDRVYEWMESGKIRLFWFVRYIDPDYHLRLRFRLPDPVDAGILLHRIYQSTRDFLREDLLWKIEASTYEPEYERYGKDRIRLVEEWFGRDSLYWLERTRLSRETGGRETWKDAIRSTDALLRDFRASEHEKIRVLRYLHDSSANLLELDKDLRIRIDDKYRRLSDELPPLLYRSGRPADPLLMKRSEESEYIVREIEKTFPGRDTLFSSTLLPDLIHMSLNRAFRTRHRLQEFLIYDFMLRHLESSLARAGQDIRAPGSA